MTGNKNTIQTAEDLLRFLDEQVDLDDTRRRDLKSAVNRFGDLAGSSPRSLRLEVPSLREKSRKIRPAAHGVGWKTWLNIKCLFGAALELAGVAEGMPRGVALRHVVWGPLMRAIANDKRLANGLAAFANWCALQDISPDQVDDEVLHKFHRWLEIRTLCPKPRDVVRRVPNIWNEAGGRFDIWPKVKLTPLSFKMPRKHLPWEALNAGFRRDVEAYLKMRSNPDLFDERPNAPTRKLAAGTLGSQREHLRLAASVLIESGVSVDALTSLAALVRPAHVKTILRHYHLQANEQPNAFVVCLVQTFLQVAQYHLNASADEMAELKRLASKLPPVPFELTAKNKALLRQFESDALRAELLFLPDQLMADVMRKLEKDEVDFVKAQVAIAIDFQLAIPLRPQNLSALNRSRHFVEPDGPKGRLLLHIPKEEMKRPADYTAEVPEDVAKRLRWYRRHILSRLGGDGDGFLFVTAKGRLKDQRTITVQIIRVIERYLGVHMTPHQFRHLCGTSYLEAQPEDTETARALLGHSSVKTTRIYVGSATRRASRAYGEHLFRQREALKLKRKRHAHRNGKRGWHDGPA
jgi:integrase